MDERKIIACAKLGQSSCGVRVHGTRREGIRLRCLDSAHRSGVDYGGGPTEKQSLLDFIQIRNVDLLAADRMDMWCTDCTESAA
jgi:hypothetical protein